MIQESEIDFLADKLSNIYVKEYLIDKLSKITVTLVSSKEIRKNKLDRKLLFLDIKNKVLIPIKNAFKNNELSSNDILNIYDEYFVKLICLVGRINSNIQFSGSIELNKK